MADIGAMSNRGRPLAGYSIEGLFDKNFADAFAAQHAGYLGVKKLVLVIFHRVVYKCFVVVYQQEKLPIFLIMLQFGNYHRIETRIDRQSVWLLSEYYCRMVGVAQRSMLANGRSISCYVESGVLLQRRFTMSVVAAPAVRDAIHA